MASSNEAPSCLSVTGWILGSIGSSVGLILVNKVIMSSEGYGFGYVFTLTAMHFLITAVGMECMAMLAMFSRQSLPLFDTFIMAVFCIGSVAFMNFSLKMNSIGFYQITKLLCIPCMVFLQTYFYGQSFNGKTKATLIVVLAGVGIATVTDLDLNEIGCIMGALAVVFTAQFQIWQGDKQKANKMNAMQMNHAQAFPSFLVCATLALLFEFRGEPKSNFLEHNFKPNEYAWIFLSCALALSVNLCTYGLIGKTSAVTYQVVGHAKTCLILLGGFIFFPNKDLTTTALAKNLVGIFIALIGVMVYSNLKITESSPVKQDDWCDMLIPRSCLNLIDSNPTPSSQGYEMVRLEEANNNSNGASK